MAFLPARMRKFTVIYHMSYSKALLDRAHALGITEVRPAKKMDKELEGLVGEVQRPDALRELSDMDVRLLRLLEVLSRVRPPPGGMASGLLCPPRREPMEVPRLTFYQAKVSIRGLFEAVEGRLLDIDSELDRLDEELATLSSRRAALQRIGDLDFDLSVLGDSAFTFAKVGLATDPAGLSSAMQGTDVAIILGREAEEGVPALIVGHRADRPEAEARLKGAGFTELNLSGLEGRPVDALQHVEGSTAAFVERRRSLMAGLSEIKSAYHDKILWLHEELTIERERSEAVSRLGATDYARVLRGWVQARKVDELRTAVLESTEGYGHVVVEEPTEDDDVPVVMDNPRFLRPFETLTTMFARPRYDEVDPTIIIAPVFVLFFGLMLGDALYGVIITAFSAVLYWGNRGANRGMSDFAIILISVGVSTIVFGVIQGGYLGPFNENTPNVTMMLGLEVPAMLDAMKDPIALLKISIAVGLVYLNLALALAAYMNLKARRYRDVVTGQVCWWLLQPGAYALLIANLFPSFPVPGFLASPTVSGLSVPGMALLAGGLIPLIVEKKGLFFFELTGFIGNLLSFARLLALGLATAGIALTINVLVNLIKGADFALPLAVSIAVLAVGGIVAGTGLRKSGMKRNVQLAAGGALSLFGLCGLAGAIWVFFLLLGAIVFIVGHVINCGLQALGSFVHSLRLQYVEFFGYFYEGGGREFEPFGYKRRFTTVQETRSDGNVP